MLGGRTLRRDFPGPICADLRNIADFNTDVALLCARNARLTPSLPPHLTLKLTVNLRQNPGVPRKIQPSPKFASATGSDLIGPRTTPKLKTQIDARHAIRIADHDHAARRDAPSRNQLKRLKFGRKMLISCAAAESWRRGHEDELL